MFLSLDVIFRRGFLMHRLSLVCGLVHCLFQVFYVLVYDVVCVLILLTVDVADEEVCQFQSHNVPCVYITLSKSFK
jgi:hypothetical protein